MRDSYSTSELERLDEATWRIAPRGAMRVPARLEQLANVATLPGVVDAALAMPDIHQGYGFPVGGVAATELPDGVVSPRASAAPASSARSAPATSSSSCSASRRCSTPRRRPPSASARTS